MIHSSEPNRYACQLVSQADLRLQFGADIANDMIRRLQSLDDISYDPFQGMSLEELGRERQKWMTCLKFFESELRAYQASSGPSAI